MFTLTDDEWEAFKQRYPKAASLKTVPLPFPDLCATLFDGNSASGNMAWSSSQTTSGVGSSSIRGLQTLQIMDTSHDDDGTSYHTGDHFMDQPSPSPRPGPSPSPPPAPSPSPPPGHSPSPPPGASPSDGRPTKKSKTSITLEDLAGDMQQVMQHMLKQNNGPTIKDCYEKLLKVELSTSDPLFVAAIRIFGGSNNIREAWMIMPDDNRDLLVNWLKMTAREKGLYN